MPFMPVQIFIQAAKMERRLIICPKLPKMNQKLFLIPKDPRNTRESGAKRYEKTSIA